MARKRKRRHFGASTWQMTERLFARAGGAPRRRTVCKVEMRVLKSVVRKLGRGYPGSAHGDLENLGDAWSFAQHGQCRKARRKLAKVIKGHPSLLNRIDRLQREGYIRIPGRDIYKILTER